MSSDNSITAGDATNNDSTLIVPIGAAEAWEFEAFLLVNQAANSGGGIRYTFSVRNATDTADVAVTSILWTSSIQTLGSTTVTQQGTVATSAGEVTVSSFGDTATRLIRIRGHVVANGAGTLKFRWAQNTSDSDVTRVLTSSFLKAGKF